MVLSTEKCIFQNGVPVWGLEAFPDYNTVTWDARSLSDGKHLTFVKNSVWEPLATVLIKPTNVLEGLDLTVDQLGSSKEDDPWKDVENKYKQLLNDCRQQCIDDESCTTVYGTMKVVRPRQTAGADPDYEDDVEEYIKGIKEAELIFKCYSYGDKTQEYSMRPDYMEKCNGTIQFDVGGKEPDLDAVASHVWHKEGFFGSIVGNEDCATCVYHAGIPKSAFKTINKEWSPGSFAVHDLTFMKQQSTVYAEILTKPVNLFAEASTDAKSADGLRYETSSWPDWQRMETAYQTLLSNCSKKCNNTENCYYAYAAVKFLTKGDLRMPNLEDDIKDHLKDNDSSFVFKCYGLGAEKAPLLAAVDTEHTKDKTPQFSTEWENSSGTMKEQEDLRVMFSHVYKNPVPIVPKSKTTTAATTPASPTEASDGCECSSAVQAARDLKKATNLLESLAKQI